MVRRFVTGAGLLLAAGVAWAQRPELSAKDALDALYNQYRGKLPNCLDVSKAREAAEEDVQWLSRRFEQTGWSSIAPEYVASLNDLYYTVRDASNNRDLRRACEAVLAVMRDINIKRQDCREIVTAGQTFRLRSMSGRAARRCPIGKCTRYGFPPATA